MEIKVVGIGSGAKNNITIEAMGALEDSTIIVGYKLYVDFVRDILPYKNFFASGMTREVERAEKAIKLCLAGESVAVISSGDAGIYGMASLIFEIIERDKIDDINVKVISGVTAATSAAAVLGAPLTHDFAVISLSDLMTDWALIEKRLYHASLSDFIIALYNPMSKNRSDYLKKACDIIMKARSGDVFCGYVRNIGREDEENKIVTLSELANIELDMVTTIIIGNSSTKVINSRLVTPRGYRV